jgi:DNA-binding transcriptional LysR family regulator
VINLYHLKYFYDAAQASSMTQSARLNGLSRPGISQAIQSLENILGVDLVHHQKKKFILSNEGQWLFSRCREIFDALESVSNEITAQGKVLRGNLKVGCSRSLAAHLLPSALASITQLHPQLKVSVSLDITDNILKAVRERELDVGVVLVDEKKSLEGSVFLGAGKFVGASAGRLKSDANPLYLCTEDRPETLQFKKHLQSKGSPQFLEVKSWDLISELLAQGLGIGLIPEFILKMKNFKNLKQLKNLPSFGNYKIIAFPRAGASPQVSAFLEILK